MHVQALVTGFQMLYRLSQYSKYFMRKYAELSQLTMPITRQPEQALS